MKKLHGENSSAWQGGHGTISKAGYIVHTVRKKVLFQHRLVMEAHIGRPLTSNEVVHHINGIRTDNRIGNLVLCQSHAEHARIHHTKGSGKRTTCRLCDKPELAKGLCNAHYKRQRRSPR